MSRLCQDSKSPGQKTSLEYIKYVGVRMNVFPLNIFKPK